MLRSGAAAAAGAGRIVAGYGFLVAGEGGNENAGMTPAFACSQRDLQRWLPNSPAPTKASATTPMPIDR
jgi:hypothetical protein